MLLVEVDLPIFTKGHHESAIFDKDRIGLNIIYVTIGLKCLDCTSWDFLVVPNVSINGFIFNNEKSANIAKVSKL